MTVKDSTTELWIADEKFFYIRAHLNNAYQAWRNGKFGNGPWYVWFEHHAEINLGIKCEMNYDRRTAHDIRIIDEEKFLMFMLKYA
jgi:hypothetical protein